MVSQGNLEHLLKDIGSMVGLLGGMYTAYEIAHKNLDPPMLPIEFGIAVAGAYVGFKLGPAVLATATVGAVLLFYELPRAGVRRYRKASERRKTARQEARVRKKEDLEARLRSVLTDEDYQALMATPDIVSRVSIDTSSGALDLCRDEEGRYSVRTTPLDYCYTRNALQRETAEGIAVSLGISCTFRGENHLHLCGYRASINVGDETELSLASRKVAAAQDSLTRYLAGERLGWLSKKETHAITGGRQEPFYAPRIRKY